MSKSTPLIPKPFSCSACHKRFGTKDSARDHAKAAHPNAREICILECVEVIRHAARDDDEPSIADQVVEASMNRAMGVPNADWLEDILDV